MDVRQSGGIHQNPMDPKYKGNGNDFDAEVQKEQESKEKQTYDLDAIVETLTDKYFSAHEEHYKGFSQFEKDFMKSMYAAGIIAGLKHAHGDE